MDSLEVAWGIIKGAVYKAIATATAKNSNKLLITYQADAILKSYPGHHKVAMDHIAEKLNSQEGYTAIVDRNIRESVRVKQSVYDLKIVWFGLEIDDE